MRRLDQHGRGEAGPVRVIVAAACGLVGLRDAHFLLQQGVDPAILLGQRTALRIAAVLNRDAQAVRFVEQQLANGEGFRRRVPGRCGIGGGVMLGFGGNGLGRDFPPADDHRFSVHRASFLERTT